MTNIKNGPSTTLNTSDYLETLRTGMFMARAVYGDSNIAAEFRGENPNDVGMDDLYINYLKTQGWSLVEGKDLMNYVSGIEDLSSFWEDNYFWENRFEGNNKYNSLKEAIYGNWVKYTIGGLYNTEDAQALVAVKDGVLSLSFRGTDAQDPAASGQAWTGNGLFNHYNMHRPLIDAVLGYVKDNKNNIEKVIVSGHSLGGAMADVFTVVDGQHFINSGINLQVTSFASPGLAPSLLLEFDKMSGFRGIIDEDIVKYKTITSIRKDYTGYEREVVQTYVDKIQPPDWYFGLSHNQDRVHDKKSESIDGNLSLIPALTLNGIRMRDKTKIINLNNILNSEVDYQTIGFFSGFGSHHNGQLYWHNINSIYNDELMIFYKNHEISIGIDYYNNSKDYAGDQLSLFNYYKPKLNYNDINFLLNSEYSNYFEIYDDKIHPDKNSISLYQDKNGTNYYISNENLVLLRSNDKYEKSINGTSSDDYILGLSGDDVLIGGFGNDLLSGGDGNDILIGGVGSDVMHGGDGIDLASYHDATSGVIADLGDSSKNKGIYALGDIYVDSSIEGLIGSEYDDLLSGDFQDNKIAGNSGIDHIYGRGGDDHLYGNSGDDHLFGGDDDDHLYGGQGMDTLFGGDGIDTAVYSLDRSEYFVFKQSNGTFIVQAKNGLPPENSPVLGIDPTEGIDFLSEIERIKFNDWEGDISELIQKAPLTDKSIDILSGDGSNFGVMSLQAPTYSTETDVDFRISLASSKQATQYKIALIIDISGSMGWDGALVEAKAAYVNLINHLKGQGIADVTEFAVIPFDASAWLYEGLTADQAITHINSLYPQGGTEFGPAIARGLEFFGSPNPDIVNIAYFLSDGEGYGASEALQAVADVRAFGVGGGVSISSLNLIDSNDAVILESASDLAASFVESEIKTADVDRIEVYLNGALVQTIPSAELVDQGGTAGLSFTGSVKGLDPQNSNTLEAKIFFKDDASAGEATPSENGESPQNHSPPAQSVILEISNGATEATGSDGDDNIIFSMQQTLVEAGAGTDTIIANNLDNIIVKTHGNGVIQAHGGDDIIYAGDNRSSGLDRVIDGGEGVDTVVYQGKRAEYQISKAGSLLKVGTNTDSLSNIEFLQFDDVKIRVSDLAEVRVVSAEAARVSEGDDDGTLVFTVKLDAPSNLEITLDFSTLGGTAEAGQDFQDQTGSLVFAPGETEKTISIELIGDIVFEGDEFFKLRLSNLQGAVFSDGNASYDVMGVIEDDDDAPQALETSDEGEAVVGGKGDDLLSGGAGDDILRGGPGDDQIFGGEGNDQLFGEEGDDELHGDLGSDALHGGAGRDLLHGGQGDDLLHGEAEDDRLFGDEGNDQLFGGEGNDELTGGSGDDALDGGPGSDSYRFGPDWGHDVISNHDDLVGTEDYAKSDLIIFEATVSAADIWLHQEGEDLLLTHTDRQNSIRVVDHFKGIAHQIDGIIFENGETWMEQEMEERLGERPATPSLVLLEEAIMVEEGALNTLGAARVVVELEEAAAEDVVIQFETIDGTALGGADFTARSGLLTIKAGETQGEILIDVLGDEAIRANRSFEIALTALGGALFASGAAQAKVSVEIQDASVSYALAAFSEGGLALSEGEEARFTVTRSGDLRAEETLGFSLRPAGESPVSAEDFKGGLWPSGSLVFAPGEIEAQIAFELAKDAYEGPESFEILLTAPEGSRAQVGAPLAVAVREHDRMGTPGADLLTGDDQDNILHGMGGRDVFSGGGGNDVYRLGDGPSIIEGAAADLWGDRAVGFGDDDVIRFTEGVRSLEDLAISTSASGATIRLKGAAETDPTLTLEGDLSGGRFVAAPAKEATDLFYASFLREADFVEGRGVDAAQINGGPNIAALTGDGERSFSLALRDAAKASFKNTVGVYEIDQEGAIRDVRLLVKDASVKSSSAVAIDGVEEGHALGFFIVQDAAGWANGLGASDVLSFVSSSGASAKTSDGGSVRLAVNGQATSQTVFHSYAASLNSDGVEHARFGVSDTGSAVTVAFEDLVGGGDRDYQDVVFDLLIV